MTATLNRPDEPDEREEITLGLGNRGEVIRFIDGPFHEAHEPDDPGSDVVVVDLVDRRAVVILGETVTRTGDEFLVTTRNGYLRDRFPRVR